MGEKLTVHREQIAISDERTMNIYTFDLNDIPMPEMQVEDVVQTVKPEPAEKSDKPEG